VTAASLARLRAQLPDDAEFARAAGNRWTEVIGGAIPADLWATVRDVTEIPDGVPVGFGAARAVDGSHVVVAAAADLGGRVVSEVLEVLPAHAAADRVKSWADGNSLAVRRDGPSAGLADELERLRVQLLPVTARDEAAACMNLTDGLPAKAYTFRPHPALDAAVRVAGRRRTAGGGYVWAPTAAGASIAALDAVTMAAYAVTHRRPVLGPAQTTWAAA
jgi:hypothetical protein